MVAAGMFVKIVLLYLKMPPGCLDSPLRCQGRFGITVWENFIRPFGLVCIVFAYKFWSGLSENGWTVDKFSSAPGTADSQD